jgi:dTDP-4-amino-4,6-dideoxygalactose transaminase
MIKLFKSEGDYVDHPVDVFEDKLRGFGVKNPIATNSCTSALHMALLLSNVGPGDEVILPAVTFVATGLAVLYCGAKPVFCDTDLGSGVASVESIISNITDKTKAIIVVDWCGYPYNLRALDGALGDLNAISIIQDAAQSFGSYRMYGNVLYNVGNGAIADFTCFSFQDKKQVSCGDGGALACKNKEDYDRARKMVWYGWGAATPRNDVGYRVFDIDQVGYKYNMPIPCAIKGLESIKLLDNEIRQRRLVAATLWSEVVGLNSIDIVPTTGPHNNLGHAWYIFPVMVERRVEFANHMRARDIEVSALDQRIDQSSVFGGKRNLPNTNSFNSKFIALPCHSGLLDNNAQRLSYMIDAIKRWR